jgi:hypothetical protein
LLCFDFLAYVDVVELGSAVIVCWSNEVHSAHGAMCVTARAVKKLVH